MDVALVVDVLVIGMMKSGSEVLVESDYSELKILIKTDDELFRVDLEWLEYKGLLNEQNVADAYLKNLIIYPY